MKTLIRKSVFETNSSSAHSISLASEDKEFVMDSLYPDQNGVVRLIGGEFGWEWFKHNDAGTKANYAAQDLYDNESAVETLIEVIKEQTGADEVILDCKGGYIDHDSVGLVPKDREGLRNFIFNKNSWLFGGNDNSRPDPMFYNVPEFKGGRQILPVYTHELSVDGLERTTKFTHKPTDDELNDGLHSILEDVVMTESGHFIEYQSAFERISIRGFKLAYFDEHPISKGYVYFEHEDRFELNELVKSTPNYDNLSWKERSNLKTKIGLKNGFIKKVKFNLKEI